MERQLVSFENTFFQSAQDMDRWNNDVFARTTIDGYPASELDEGQVVATCSITNHGDIDVVFHHNSYRETPAVIELIENSITQLKTEFLQAHGGN